MVWIALQLNRLASYRIANSPIFGAFAGLKGLRDNMMKGLKRSTNEH